MFLINFNNLREICFCVLIIIFPSISATQVQENGFQINSSFGKVVKHNKEIVGNPSEELSWQLGLSYSIRKINTQLWRIQAKFPEVRLNFLISDFGNRSVFGNAIALYPSIKFYFGDNKRDGFSLDVGVGIARLNKKFDQVNNTQNTAIASSVNSIAQGKLGYNHTSSKIKVIIEGGLTHHSNIGVTQPNLGLNYLGANIGLQYLITNKKETSKEKAEKPFKGHGNLGLKMTLGYFDYEEVQFDENHKHAIVQSFTAYGIWRNSRINQLYAGIKYTRNEGQARRAENKAKHIISIIVGDELRIGKIGLFVSLGIYLYKKYETPNPIYTEIGSNFYFTKNAFFGFNMKNHFGVAEYPEAAIGFIF